MSDVLLQNFEDVISSELIDSNLETKQHFI